MPISDALKEDAFSQESDLPLVLILIEHDDLSTPIRCVNNKVDITSNGKIFTAFPFEIILPDASEDAPPRAKLRINNVSREIGQAIRTVMTPPSLTIQVVRQDTPDVVEAEFVGMSLTNVTYDSLVVEADLMFEDLTREPYPSLRFNPSYFRGII